MSKINISLHSILDANKLTKPNFFNWYWNVIIVLKQQRKLYVLETWIPFICDEDTDNKVHSEYQCHIDDDEQAKYVMLSNMSLKLQTQHWNMNVHIIIMHLKKLFDATSIIERYETFKELFHCKMIEFLSEHLCVENDWLF
jgi:hypothetical protein